MSQPRAQTVRFRGTCRGGRRQVSTGRETVRADTHTVSAAPEPDRDTYQQPVAFEPWLDKRGLARHLMCSVRWVEARMADGMPHVRMAGRAKFHLSEVEPWLQAHGHIERRGEAAAA